ncbi:MAG TPA: pseudaminic acid biosynthesis-associated methylase [Candidatus Limnocylindrales bacterium]|nr:pseudaminic acid biosynthesis-associated methylase [Candidatus Limnocylindrales bacterium]
MDEAERLERLWAGDFGKRYADRNAVLDGRRAAFWHDLVDRHGIRSVLEVGCGQGGNLAPLVQRLEPADVWGIDVNDVAIARARINAPGANIVRSRARLLPFRDGFVDLAFTMGVLIHQPEESLATVIAEIARCARSYVLWGEYHAPQTEAVPYHGETGALFRRDYADIYRTLHPELSVVDEGFLDADSGFDRVTWQLLARR